MLSNRPFSLRTSFSLLGDALVDAYQHLKRPLSLFDRLSLSFLVLFVFSASATWLLCAPRFSKLAVELDQRLNLSKALPLGDAIERLSLGTLDREKVERVLFKFEQDNPRFRAYLIDTKGAVIASGSKTDTGLRNIDPTPLVMLAKMGERLPPFLGSSPLDTSEQRWFSVARIALDGEPFFVYVLPTTQATLSLHKGRKDTSRTLREYRSDLLLLFCLPLLICEGYLLYLSLRTRSPITSTWRTDPSQGEGEEVSALASAVTSLARSAKSKARLLNTRDEQRRSFVTGVSNNLRETLGNLQRNVSALLSLQWPFLKDDTLQTLQSLSADTDRVIGTINQILDIAKYESLEDDLNPHRFPACECIQDVALQHEALCTEYDVSLVHDLGYGGPVILGDIELVCDALSRLVHNAIVFSPPGSSVALNAAEDEDFTYLTVEDKGCGIPQKEVPYLFDSFFRGRRAFDLGIDGHGLGLFVVKKIMEAHKGTISIYTEGEKGTKITIGFPKRQENRRAPQVLEPARDTSLGSSDEDEGQDIGIM